MSAVATAVVGGAVVGGYISSRGQKQAAETAAGAQIQASNQAAELQREQFQMATELARPYVNAGTAALNQQLALLGISQPHQTLRDFSTNKAFGQVPSLTGQSTNLPQFNGALGIRGAPTIGNIPQAQGIQSTTALPTTFEPYTLPGPGQQTSSPYADIINSPEFQALQAQGEEAILQNAAATGGLRGGNTQAALAQFRPQLLSELINKRLTQLGQISSLGQAAAAGQASSGENYASNLGNLYGQIGAAQAGSALVPSAGQGALSAGIGAGTTLGATYLGKQWGGV